MLCVSLMSLLVIITRITGPSKRVINDFSNFFFFLKRVLTHLVRTRYVAMHCLAYLCPLSYKRGVREIQTLSHWKLRCRGPTFDNGDDVSISVRPHGPAIQIRTVGVQWLHDPAIQTRTIGVQWLHEEEGDDDDIQSKDEVLNAHNSSDDDAHVAKVEIASRIFRNYYCAFRSFLHDGNFIWWFFAKKGLEIVLF